MEIFKLFGTILVDSSKADESISKTETKAEGLGAKLGNGIKTAAKWGAAVAAGVVAAGAAIMKTATSAAAATDEIDKMSQKIGISREAYQELAFACSQSGTDVNVLKNGMKTLTDQMQSASEGGKKASSAFETLGVSIYDSNGKLKDQEAMMFEAMSALQGIDDQTQKAALAVDLFGKAGTELMPMLNGASGSIDDMRQQAHELGLVLSDDAINAGVSFTDTMDQLKRSFSAVTTNIGVELMPIIMEFATWIIDHMPEIQEVISTVFSIISGAVKLFVDAIAEAIRIIQQWAADNQETVETIKTLFQGLFDVLKGAFAVFRDIFSGDWKTLFSETLPNLLNSAFDVIDNLLRLLLDGLVAIVKGIGSALFEAGKEIFTQLWDGIKEIWQSIKDWVGEKVDWLADKLFFWRNAQDEMDGGGKAKAKPDGSHAGGLAYVPYDRYRAELHRGEKVLTADQAREYDAGAAGQSGGGDTYVFNSPKALTPAEAARQMKKAKRALLLGI